jgi:hypothetical protein
MAATTASWSARRSRSRLRARARAPLTGRRHPVRRAHSPEQSRVVRHDRNRQHAGPDASATACQDRASIGNRCFVIVPGSDRAELSDSVSGWRSMLRRVCAASCRQVVRIIFIKGDVPPSLGTGLLAARDGKGKWPPTSCPIKTLANIPSWSLKSLRADRGSC